MKNIFIKNDLDLHTLERIMTDSTSYEKIRIQAILSNKKELIGVSEKCRIFFKPTLSFLVDLMNKDKKGKIFNHIIFQKIDNEIDDLLIEKYRAAFIKAIKSYYHENYILIFDSKN